MRDKPIVQPELTDNYDVYWQNMVADVIERKFQNVQAFISMYLSNYKKLIGIIVNNMKVVPFDLKAIIASFYQTITTSTADNDGGGEPPRRSVA